MNMKEALRIIYKEPKGFRVHFEWKNGREFISDWFPDNGWIEHEEIAWAWAKLLAEAALRRIVNVYVIDYNHVPVMGYEERKIKNY